MPLHILIVEDDHLQEGPFEEQLRDAFPDADIETVPTEKEFRQRLPGYRTRPPDVVIMDVMLRWDFPTRNAEAPPADVVDGGYHWAGLRCAGLMAADAKLKRTPVVFCTIVERTDLERDGRVLPPNSRYVRKSSDLDVLTRTVRDVSRAGQVQ
jgi:DNA-binding NarL/FixJ family response regulator